MRKLCGRYLYIVSIVIIVYIIFRIINCIKLIRPMETNTYAKFRQKIKMGVIILTLVFETAIKWNSQRNTPLRHYSLL